MKIITFYDNIYNTIITIYFFIKINYGYIFLKIVKYIQIWTTDTHSLIFICEFRNSKNN